MTISKERMKELAIEAGAEAFGADFDLLPNEPFIHFAHVLLKAVEQESEVVGYFGYEKVHGIDVRSFSGHQSGLHNAPLYARKEPK